MSNIFTLAVITLAIIIGLTITFYFSSIENNKIEAQRIIEFQNTDHSCDELKNFYLKYYPKKYNSQNDCDVATHTKTEDPNV